MVMFDVGSVLYLALKIIDLSFVESIEIGVEDERHSKDRDVEYAAMNEEEMEEEKEEQNVKLHEDEVRCEK